MPWARQRLSPVRHSARLAAADGAINVEFADGATLPMPANRVTGLRERGGREVTFGVRTEHFSRQRGEDGPDGFAPLRVTIDLIQPTGTRTYATFQLAGTRVMAELQAHDVERPGEDLSLLVDMNRIVLIDPETERVI